MDSLSSPSIAELGLRAQVFSLLAVCCLHTSVHILQERVPLSLHTHTHTPQKEAIKGEFNSGILKEKVKITNHIKENKTKYLDVLLSILKGDGKVVNNIRRPPLIQLPLCQWNIGVKPPEGNSRSQAYVHTPIIQRHFYYVTIIQTAHISFIFKIRSP